MANVEGLGADGQPVRGYPVRVAGKDGSGNTQGFLVDSSGIHPMGTRITLVDGATNQATSPLEENLSQRSLPVYSFGYNGATWDRQRNNVEINPVLALAARTAQTDSTAFFNYNARGVTLIVKITVDPGTASITPNVAMRDPVSGDYVIIWTAAAALTGVGNTIYQLYPGVLAADFNGTESVSIVLPRTWIFRMAVADGESMTYSVAGSYTL